MINGAPPRRSCYQFFRTASPRVAGVHHPAMTTSRARSRLDIRARFPFGVATAGQLEDCGVPQRTTYHRCRPGGPWQRPLPGIIVLSTGHLTADQVVAAALLLGGPDAVVTGVEACRRLGMRRGPAALRSSAAPVEVALIVPHDRQVRDVGFVHVERSTRMPTPWIRGGIPLAPPDRALMSAVRRMNDYREIAELLAEGVQRELTTVSALWTEMELGSRRGTANPRTVLLEVSEGVRSAAELDAKKLLSRAGMPEAWWNVEIRDGQGRLLGIADAWFDDVAMAWEIDSTEWHLSPADHDRTVRKAAAFGAAGVLVFPSKPSDIRKAGPQVLAQLRAAHAHAATRARPNLTARRL
jgi:hypothetical protein